MNRSLKDYWYEVYHYGYRVRSFEPKNEIERWQFYKNLYSITSEQIQLSSDYKKLFESVKYKPAGFEDVYATLYIAGNEYSNNVEKFHFLVELFRIPKLSNFRVSFIKALQIAYNAGQLQATIDDDEYDQEVVDFINENRLNEITTYFKNPDQKINTKINNLGASVVNTTYIVLLILFLIMCYYMIKIICDTFKGSPIIVNDNNY
jgi:hypothetical protein